MRPPGAPESLHKHLAREVRGRSRGGEAAGGLLGGREGKGASEGGAERSQVTSAPPGKVSWTRGPGGENALEGSDAGLT